MEVRMVVEKEVEWTAMEGAMEATLPHILIVL